MKNILKIYTNDLKKIFTNSMAIILAVGILVLPSLYAWFNIYANHDPYGSTGQMQIAVIIEDEGYNFKNIEINVGEEVRKNLEANDLIDWQFLSKDEGIEGVKSGKYYAAIEIPATFSKSLTSITTSDFKRPEITYYANEKKNAIATKITDKVVQTVQTQVNESFTTTVIDIVNKLLKTVIEEANDSSDGGTVKTVLNQIDTAKTSVHSIEKTVEAFANVMKITKNIENTFSNERVKKLLEDTNGTIKSTNELIAVTKNMVSSITSSLDSALDESHSEVTGLISTLDKIGTLPTGEAVKTIEDFKKAIDRQTGKYDVLLTSLNQINGAMPIKLASLSSMIDGMGSINDSLKSLSSTLDSAINSKSGKTALQQISSELKSVDESVTKVKQQYKDTVKPALDNNMTYLVGVLSDISSIIDAIGSNEDVPTLIKTIDNSVDSGADLIDSFMSLLDGCEKQLDDLYKKINKLSDSELVNMIYNLTFNNSDKLGEFAACPVVISTQKIYAIDNYGSAMAPFYSTLAVWVGAVILVAIMKTKVRHRQTLGYTPTQEYFGRGLTFVTFSVIQGLIICLGDLIILKMQCYHPILFVLAGVCASMIFTIFIYSLVYAFEDIGKAVAVILLVLQIGGSGGTFPIDVTPKFFQAIHPYLPFTFLVNAFRECVCGTWGNDYFIDLLKLSAYIPIGLVFGLVIAKAVRKPISFFGKKVKETQIL